MATILNDVTCQRGGEYYARCDWLLSMIYYSTDTQMMFCLTWRDVWKVFVTLFCINQVKLTTI